MPGGILGHIELGRHARYGYDQRVEVFGSLGQAVSNNQRISAYEVWDASGYDLIYFILLKFRWISTVCPTRNAARSDNWYF